MLRPKATRHGRARQECGSRLRDRVRNSSASLRLGSLLAFSALVLAPFANAQHTHPAPAPHMSAPHMPGPRMSAQPRMQAPRPYQASPEMPSRVPTQMRAPQNNYAPPRPSPYQRVPNNPALTNRPLNAAPNTSAPMGFAPSRPPYSPGGVGYQQVPRNQYAMPPTRPGHLGSWLENHQGQSFASQENSLRQEPGFNRLPAQQQQRMINHLQRLESMPPQKRALALGRIENMERLSPERQQAVRNSAQELSGMDSARRQQVRGAFRSLRALPPSQRQAMLSSPEYRSQYSEHERQMLGNLLSVEPYNPQ